MSAEILLPTRRPLDDRDVRSSLYPLAIMSWYYAQEGQRIGPVSDEELTRLTKDNVVTPSTLVWRYGMAEWQPWGSVVVSALPESALCQGCNRPFLKDDLVSIQGVMVCSACKPVQLQRVREGRHQVRRPTRRTCGRVQIGRGLLSISRRTHPSRSRSGIMRA